MGSQGKPAGYGWSQAGAQYRRSRSGSGAERRSLSITVEYALGDFQRGALGRGESASEMDMREEWVEQLIAVRSLPGADWGQDHQQHDQDGADEEAQAAQHSTSADRPG